MVKDLKVCILTCPELPESNHYIYFLKIELEYGNSMQNTPSHLLPEKPFKEIQKKSIRGRYSLWVKDPHKKNPGRVIWYPSCKTVHMQISKPDPEKENMVFF